MLRMFKSYYLPLEIEDNISPALFLQTLTLKIFWCGGTVSKTVTTVLDS